MIPLWIFVVFLALAATLLIVSALRKQSVPPADLDWMESFSVAKYRPMQRLLSERDFEFLASQPGYHPSISRKLRKERRRIFGSYLSCMTRDFQRLYDAAARLALSAAEDRAEFSSTLVRQKLRFQLTVLEVRGRLVLYSLGIGTVDVSGLLNSVVALNAEVRRLQPQLQRIN
jgi:hypothetical protein